MYMGVYAQMRLPETSQRRTGDLIQPTLRADFDLTQVVPFPE